MADYQDPTTLPQFETARGAADSAVEAAKSVPEISDEESATEAAELIAMLANARKVIDTQRTVLVKPHNDFTRGVNAAFKELLGPVDGAERALKARLASYQREQERKAQEERERQERNARERQRRENEKARQEQREPTQHTPPPVPTPAPTRTTASGSRVTTKKVWQFEITDVEQIPREYMEPNKRAIRQAVNGGAREIPGVRIFEDTQVAAR